MLSSLQIIAVVGIVVAEQVAHVVLPVGVVRTVGRRRAARVAVHQLEVLQFRLQLILPMLLCEGGVCCWERRVTCVGCFFFIRADADVGNF